MKLEDFTTVHQLVVFSDTQAGAFSIIIDKNVSDKDNYCRWMQRIQYSITTITVFISLWSGTCAL